jgi:hypothetical protein
MEVHATPIQQEKNGHIISGSSSCYSWRVLRIFSRESTGAYDRAST